MNFRFKSLPKALAVLVLPLVEFVAMRVYVRDFLNIRIGWPLGTTDYDLIWPMALSYLLVFCLIEGETVTRLSFNHVASRANAFFLGLFIALTWRYGHLVSTDSEGLAYFIPWAILSGAVLTTAVFTWLPWKFFFQGAARYYVLPALVVSSTSLISKRLFAGIWEPVNAVTGSALCSMIKTFSATAHCAFNSADARGSLYTIVVDPPFALAVGKGCSGVEGMFFFFLLFSALVFLDLKRFRPVWTVALFVMGTAYMYLLNLVRLFVFFRLSRSAFETYGDDTGVQTFLMLSHDSLGWVLYTVGIGFFLVFVYRTTKVTSQEDVKLPLAEPIRA